MSWDDQLLRAPEFEFDHWAFQPIKRPSVPGSGEEGASPVSAIDAFLAHERSQVGVAANGPAARHTLMRRLSFDLTGLPPTPETAQIEQRPRTALADWLTDRRNPLTARVWVNRIWQYHFGRGLVADSSDFGVRTESPIHQTLLDWLASELMDNGDSDREFHRSPALAGTGTPRPTAARSRMVWRYWAGPRTTT